MSRDDLLDGYLRVLNELYDPVAYFDRTDALVPEAGFDIGIKKKKRWMTPRDSFRKEHASLAQGHRTFRPADDQRRASAV